MTPEQLREWAGAIEGEKPWAPKVADVCDQLLEHAAALEEIERLRAERDRALNKLAIDAVQYDALLAERDRERKEHAQWVRDHQADTDAAHMAKQRAESALAERDAEIKALNGHAERFMVEREGNSRQFARLQERLAKAEADCDAYLDDATRYSRHLKGAWMDSGDERDFYVWRDEAVQVDDAWWDKEGPSINAAIDASRKPS